MTDTDLAVDRLERGDVEAALDLSTRAGWSTRRPDRRRMVDLDAVDAFAGRLDDGRPVATATLVRYGTRVCWIGMMLVHPEHRRRGYGTRMLEACLDAAEDAGVATVGLDANSDGRPLYETNGFVGVAEVSQWRGSLGGAGHATDPDRIETVSDPGPLLALDRCRPRVPPDVAARGPGRDRAPPARSRRSGDRLRAGAPATARGDGRAARRVGDGDGRGTAAGCRRPGRRPAHRQRRREPAGGSALPRTRARAPALARADDPSRAGRAADGRPGLGHPGVRVRLTPPRSLRQEIRHPDHVGTRPVGPVMVADEYPRDARAAGRLDVPLVVRADRPEPCTVRPLDDRLERTDAWLLEARPCGDERLDELEAERREHFRQVGRPVGDQHRVPSPVGDPLERPGRPVDHRPSVGIDVALPDLAGDGVGPPAVDSHRRERVSERSPVFGPPPLAGPAGVRSLGTVPRQVEVRPELRGRRGGPDGGGRERSARAPATPPSRRARSTGAHRRYRVTAGGRRPGEKRPPPA
ncbi:hypothetical protein BRC93_08125 [Halobacteriales archaeon QS_5_70_15]|nr:MAG: hypothetical protein BRC93_08125 [Halobacteriales archaeon QS_5_70_15]